MRVLRLLNEFETYRVHYSQQHDDLPKNIIHSVEDTYILKINERAKHLLEVNTS